MSLKKKINLNEGEQIIELIRATPLLHFWHFFLGTCVLVLGAFFTFWLLSYGIIGSIALTAVAFIGVIIIARGWSASKKNYWVITNRRLVDIEKHGILDETISTSALGDIKDVYVNKKGFGARFFDFGDVSVEVYNDAYALTLHGVKNPQFFADLIRGLSKRAVRRKQNADFQASINNFLRVLPALQMRELNEIKNRIENQIDVLDSESNDDESNLL